MTLNFLQANQYQSEVSRVYRKIAKEVRELLPNATVEHIGASSIPGAISKGDLDVFVGVDRDSHELAVTLLENNGYRIKRNTLRNENLCMLETSSYECPVALQIVANGSEFEMFLTFRNAVRDSEVLLHEYNQMKHLCVGLSESCYRFKKGEFIEKVLNSLAD